ncbi:hypothetical protein J7J08_06890, partial [Stenotrophomonas sp. ISL-67]|uniref:ESPR-type extended signal peptide-containing protein n=1 Tax=Stenotrophomonas sp. ISL-67 TaxID=2819171 RepID=UPI001C17EA9C
MNVIYRIIWSASLKTWVVASELSSGRRKRKTRTLLLASALLSCTAVTAAAAPDVEPPQQLSVASTCVAVADDAVNEQHCDVAEDATPRSASADASADYMVVNSTGAAAVAGGLDAIAVGTGANAEARNTIALGSNAGSTAVGGIAIGHDASVERDPEGPAGSGGMHGIAIGEGAKVGMNMDDPDWHYMKADKAMALGAYSSASGERSVALGAESVADEDLTVSVGSNSLKRRITNVAAGTQAHHAATFGQLEGAAQALGGGAGFDAATGAFKAPSYVFGTGSTFTNVGDALGELDERVGTLEDGGTGDGLIGQDADTGVIGVGAAVGGSEVNFAGTDGDRRLSGVAAGTEDNDAVNVAQLTTVNDAVQANAADIGQNAADIATNLGTIEENTTGIGQNATDIAANAASITGLDTRVGTNAADIVQNAADIATNACTTGGNRAGNAQRGP